MPRLFNHDPSSEKPSYYLIQNSWYAQFNSWCLECNLWYREMNSWYRRSLHLAVCTVNANIKGSNTRVLSHSSSCVLFIVTIRLRWRWIMMTAVIESDYVILYLSVSTTRSDWFFLVLVTFNLDSPWIHPRSLFSKGLSIACIMLMRRPNLKSVNLPVSQIISIGALWPSNLEKGGIGGREWYHQKELFYRPYQ